MQLPSLPEVLSHWRLPWHCIWCVPDQEIREPQLINLIKGRCQETEITGGKAAGNEIYTLCRRDILLPGRINRRSFAELNYMKCAGAITK